MTQLVFAIYLSPKKYHVHMLLQHVLTINKYLLFMCWVVYCGKL